MSGHSKWHKIRHQKEITDKKKGQLFGKMAREIANLARLEKDPTKNPTLREAITRAKKANMPQSNIDRLLQGSDKPLTAIMYEGFDAHSVGLLVATETDNPNRTFNEIRTIFKEHGGQLGEPGSVKWKFTPTYQASIQKPASSDTEHVELALIDAGVTEIIPEDEDLYIIASPSNQTRIKDTLQNLNLDIHHEETVFIPNESITLSKEDERTLQELCGALEHHADVLTMYCQFSLHPPAKPLQ